MRHMSKLFHHVNFEILKKKFMLDLFNEGVPLKYTIISIVIVNIQFQSHIHFKLKLIFPKIQNIHELRRK